LDETLFPGTDKKFAAKISGLVGRFCRKNSRGDARWQGVLQVLRPLQQPPSATPFMNGGRLQAAGMWIGLWAERKT
jgi:hypothetical protein